MMSGCRVMPLLFDDGRSIFFGGGTQSDEGCAIAAFFAVTSSAAASSATHYDSVFVAPMPLSRCRMLSSSALARLQLFIECRYFSSLARRA